MSTVKKIQQQVGRFWLNKLEKRVKRNVKAFSIEKASTLSLIHI